METPDYRTPAERVRDVTEARFPPIRPAPGARRLKPMPNPTPEQADSPEFNALWGAIKDWDISAPAYYRGYCGANGSHVAVLLDALKKAQPEPVTAEHPALKLLADTLAATSGPAAPEDIAKLLGHAIKATGYQLVRT